MEEKRRARDKTASPDPREAKKRKVQCVALGAHVRVD
jgi:hypothetical protein